MTISSSVIKTGPTEGNGLATGFPFTWKTMLSSDLAVYHKAVDGTITKLVENTDYSVSLNGDQNASPGGSVTYPISGSPLPAGEYLLLISEAAATQGTQFLTGGAYRGENVENALDRIALSVLQNEERYARTVRTSPWLTAPVNPELPTPVAKRGLRWNAAANGFENTDYDPDTAASVASAGAAAAAASAVEAGDFALAADASATGASNAAIAAADSAVAAAASASALVLPDPAVANTYLRRNAGNTAYEAKTATQVATELTPLIAPMLTPMFRNKLINGGFDFWDYATTQTSNGYGSDNRWYNGNLGSTKTVSRQTFALGQTDVPGNPKYFSRTVVTSVAGAANYVYKSQRIESVLTLAGESATLSFYAKADANKNIAVEFFQDFGTGGSASGQISTGVTTCALTTVWQKFTVNVTLPSISGKTLGTNGDDSLGVIFWFDSGSSYNSRNNSLGQQSGTFDISQIQLEQGVVATPFEQRPLSIERELCQRYAPIFNATSAISDVGQGGISTTSTAGIFYKYMTRTRAPATGVSVSNVAHFNLTNSAGTSSAVTALTFVRADNDMCTLSVTGTGTPYTIAQVAYLASSSASAQIIFTGCEL